MKRRRRLNRQYCNARPRPVVKFDPDPWYDALNEALATEQHPIMRLCLRDAADAVHNFATRYPLNSPSSRVRIEDMEVLATLLGALLDVGVALPGFPRAERGSNKIGFKLVVFRDSTWSPKGKSE